MELRKHSTLVSVTNWAIRDNCKYLNKITESMLNVNNPPKTEHFLSFKKVKLNLSRSLKSTPTFKHKLT